MNALKGHPKKIGRWGESRAVEFLKDNGIQILAQNIHNQFGEIDILGEDDGQIIFVEVKTLRSKKFGNPEISVNERKKSHMVNSALQYLQEVNLMDREWRIDVLAIFTEPSGKIEFTWFKNAIKE